jgi:hypothetical protein
LLLTTVGQKPGCRRGALLLRERCRIGTAELTLPAEARPGAARRSAKRSLLGRRLLEHEDQNLNPKGRLVSDIGELFRKLRFWVSVYRLHSAIEHTLDFERRP